MRLLHQISSHIDFPFTVIVSITALLIGIYYPLHNKLPTAHFEVISKWTESVIHGVVVFVSFIALIFLPGYRKSSFFIGITGISRLLLLQIHIPIHILNNILGASTYIIRLWYCVLIIDDYFIQNANTWVAPTTDIEDISEKQQWRNKGELYIVDDPEYDVAREEPIDVMDDPFPEIHASVPLQKHKDKQREQTLLLFVSIERACIIMAALCLTLYVTRGLEYANLPTFAFSIALVIVQILKVQKAVEFGASLFSSYHSHGLVVLLLLGSLSLHIFIEIVLISLKDTPFFGLSEQILTQIVPLIFHYHNIFSYHKKACDAGNRMKLSVFLMLLQLNIMFVATALLSTDHYNPPMPAIIVCARGAAWAASINFGWVALGIISPILQLVYQLVNFNIMRHAFHTIHFHRNVAICGCIFGVLHVVLQIVHTVQVGCEKSLACDAWPAATGGIILAGMVGAGITGYLGRLRNFSVISFLHFPLACMGLFGLFFHAYVALPFGTYFVLATFVGCLSIYTLFFFFNPIQPMKVNKRKTVWLQGNSNFAFLVVNYHNSSSIPPGSFFLIYSNHNSNFSYFHAHTFPVFSSKNRHIVFLVHCRTSKQKSHVSFTQQLSLGMPDSLRLQGPFQGTANSFIHYLSSVVSLVDVYLCGWDAGLANVFSILEHLKENVHVYNIRCVSCLFNAVHERNITHHTHTYMNHLVRDWHNPKTSVTIIESETCDLRNVHLMVERTTSANKEVALNYWRTKFPNRACWLVMRDLQNFNMPTSSPLTPTSVKHMSLKILYFCGPNFQPELFPFGEWRTLPLNVLEHHQYIYCASE